MLEFLDVSGSEELPALAAEHLEAAFLSETTHVNFKLVYLATVIRVVIRVDIF